MLLRGSLEHAEEQNPQKNKQYISREKQIRPWEAQFQEVAVMKE